VRALASRLTFNIGSYLGVPVRRRDGTLFGTLCVLDPATHHFQSDHLDLLIILSHWLRSYLEHELFTVEAPDVAN
jgi:diguanylate cyclase